MAFLDFLNQDVAGTSPVTTSMSSGGLEQTADVGKSGITWGQLIAAAMKGSPGQQDQVLSPGFLPTSYNKGATPIFSFANQMPVDQGQQKQGSSSDWGTILKVFSSMFGGGGAVGGGGAT